MNNMDDIVIKGKLPNGETHNEIYNDAINTIIKYLDGNKIDSEIYKKIFECVNGVNGMQESYSGRVSIDTRYLTTKDTQENIKSFLTDILHRINHPSEDSLKTLANIANLIQTQTQTQTQPSVTPEDDEPDR